MPTLSLCSIVVRNLRCHSELSWDCQPGINLLTGHNGSGKTTMLEAASILVHGRSFRQARDPELVRWGEKHFQIEARWVRYGPMYSRAVGKRGQVELSLQGKKISRRKELFETLPVLVDAPQGGRIIDGVPNERRRWLDALVQSLDPATTRDYRAYLRAMMQRRRLLKHRASAHECEAWEQQMAIYGSRIVVARSKVIDALNESLVRESELTESELILHIGCSAPESEEAWQKKLAESREKDARMGRAMFGPHCDQLKMSYQQREIRSAGSRGQQRLAAMALRLAECAVRQQQRQITPVLLLDDCLEALDPARQQRLMKRLSSYDGQVLMTAPNGINIPAGVGVNESMLTEDQIRPVTKAVPATGMEKAA